MGSILGSVEAVPLPERANKVVVITGCDSGFGLNLASHAACELNFCVVAGCLTDEGRGNLEKALSGTSGIIVQANLTDAAGIRQFISVAEDAAESVGGGIWALVNNAGVLFPGNVEWASPSSYETTMAVNFHVPVNLTYALLPRIKKERGRVINVTSVDGFIALPSNAAYNASKHALEAYSDTLRMEMLPWGVDVVIVEPGTMRTPLAMSFFKAWLQGYEAAPPDRKAPYGDKWAQAIARKGSKGLQAIAANPKVTVDAMANALVAKGPKSRCKTGTMANYFFRPVSMLPHYFQDRLLMAMSYGGAQPVGLSRL